MIRRISLLLATVGLLGSAIALEVTSASGPQPGDCAIFREGGDGVLLKAPTYWLKGTILGVTRETRLVAICPLIAKLPAAYTRDDWARAAAAIPCVEKAADVRQVDTWRIKLAVDEWETPWSYQHGTPAWLFRGHFLNTFLSKGAIIEMDASWLERCELRP